ncbi:unnamed protein product [Rotaria sp. Silwood1]|nr:unnamed protein product [Rotaria sp. Silwood1]
MKKISHNYFKKRHIAITLNRVGLPCATAIWSREAKIVVGSNSEGNNTNQLDGPYGLVLDSDGAFFVVDRGNDRVVKWQKGATNGIVAAGGHGQGSAADQLDRPTNIAVDNEGTMYITDGYNEHGRLPRWKRAADVGETLFVSSKRLIAGVVLDETEENLYVGYQYEGSVIKYVIQNNGRGQGQVVASRVRDIEGVAVDASGTVYSSGFDRVVKWPSVMNGTTPQGIVIAGGHSIGNATTQLNNPLGIHVDPSGEDVYIADAWNHRIVEVIHQT